MINKAMDTIAGALEKLGEPLTEGQKMGISGAVAVLVEHAYKKGQTDLVEALRKKEEEQHTNTYININLTYYPRDFASGKRRTK